MAILYPGSLDTFTTRQAGDTIAQSHVNDLQDAVEMLEKRFGATDDEIIVATAKMFIYADSAPANWTIDDSMDDKLIFVTKGSSAGGETGGGPHSTGTWTQADHTLTSAESGLPAHTHAVAYGTSGSNAAYYQVSGGSTGAGACLSANAAADAASAHNHGSDWRPASYCTIVCSKDAYPTS